MKNNLLKFSLVFFLVVLIFNSCSKEEGSSLQEELGKIEVLTKGKIENKEVENQVKQSLSKIKQMFNLNFQNYKKKNLSKSKQNDSISFETIEINTEAFDIIANENGINSYTFQLKYPSETIDNKEIVNLHLYYDENNNLKGTLYKYELTNEEFIFVKQNQSFDGFLDKILYLDLESIDEKTTNYGKSSLASKHPCDGIFNCDPIGYSTWTPYANNSGYGGSSGPGSSYSLPPLSTLPPSVIASLRAAGVYLGIDYNNLITVPYTGRINYTSPVLYFSTNDLIIPPFNPSSSATPFNNYYAYYFSGIKNIIKDYYKKVYVEQINSYVTSSQTTIEDHIKKQKVIHDFIQFTYTLYAQSRSNFYYLSSNHELTESIFYFLEKNNKNYLDYAGAKNFANEFISLSALNLNNLTNEEIESFFNFNQDYKNRMSPSERVIFDSMSNFEQISYLFNAQKATWAAEDLFPNSLRNGKGDAFRHAYWNALNVILLGDTLATSLATAHEDKPSSYSFDFKEKQMDLFNNAVGRSKSNWLSDGYNSLTESILFAITNGELRYLSNILGGASSGRATSSSNLTPTN